jgi:class 3 adenylate cyclase
MSEHTFVFADLSGFTAVTEAHGDERAADLAGAFFADVRAILGEHGGNEVKTIGDEAMIRCEAARGAIGLALRLVQEVGARHGLLSVRVGLHTGPATERDGDWFGATVNLAARVSGLAAGGEVLLTGASAEAAGAPGGGDLGAVHPHENVVLVPRGRRELRNVSEPVELFEASCERSRSAEHPRAKGRRRLPASFYRVEAVVTTDTPERALREPCVELSGGIATYRNTMAEPVVRPREVGRHTPRLVVMASPTATAPGSAPERPPAAAPGTPTTPPRWSAGRIAMVVGGSLLALIALAALVAGAYGLWLHTTQRSEGYVMTSSERFTTGSFAIATRTLDVSSDVPGFLYGGDWLGNVRIRGKSGNPNRPLFIGIARKETVDRYLAGMAHSEVVDVNANPFGTTYEPTYRARPGGKPAIPPRRAGFWVARVAGRGSQTLTWGVKQGRWAVVVMRPDGSRGVSADLAAGAKLPALIWVSIGLLVFGLLSAGGAVALIYFGARQPRAQRLPAGPVTSAVGVK